MPISYGCSPFTIDPVREWFFGMYEGLLMKLELRNLGTFVEDHTLSFSSHTKMYSKQDVIPPE